jgi:hypothetical protein
MKLDEGMDVLGAARLFLLCYVIVCPSPHECFCRWQCVQEGWQYQNGPRPSHCGRSGNDSGKDVIGMVEQPGLDDAMRCDELALMSDLMYPFWSTVKNISIVRFLYPPPGLDLPVYKLQVWISLDHLVVGAEKL